MRTTTKKIGSYLFLISTSLLFIVPMILTVLSSVKGNREIFSNPFGLPEVYRFSNYTTAWIEANMGRYFLNTIVIAGGTVILLIIVATMASYILSRYSFLWNRTIFLFFLLGMMIPMHSVLVPIAYMIGALQLKNNIFALIMVYVAFSLSFSILVLVNFMKTIPSSLEEAAIIDGASMPNMYAHIIVPLSAPAISTISIFNFLGAWNGVVFPLIFINDSRLKPISLGLLNFNGERGSEYGLLMAAIAITVCVPMIVYLLFQEKIEGGLTAGSIKG